MSSLNTNKAEYSPSLISWFREEQIC